MRVVFLEDVFGVARGGDVKEVKNGFARNYLLPKNLAVPATHNALQRIQRLSKEADVARLQTLSDMAALAKELEDVQVDVEMRAGTSGRLYGSVTNTIIAEELAKVTDREIDRRTVILAEPIRRLGRFDVALRLHAEVETSIKVLVYAAGTDPAQAPLETEEAPEEAAGTDALLESVDAAAEEEEAEEAVTQDESADAQADDDETEDTTDEPEEEEET